MAKSALVAFCRARGVPFVDDPSNADPAYARTRLRALMAALATKGLDAEGLARLARRAAEADEALARMTAEVEARLGRTARSTPTRSFAAPIAIVQRVLVRRIARAGGRDESPDRAREDRGAGDARSATPRRGAARSKPMSAGAVARLTAKGKARVFSAGAGTEGQKTP